MCKKEIDFSGYLSTNSTQEKTYSRYGTDDALL
jgi:hypothetical protein